MKKRFLILLAALLCLVLPACAEVLVDETYAISDTCEVTLGEAYSSEEEVALYLYAFAELPVNYLTKAEARALGWVGSEGNLWDVAYGMSIGGDVFGNREGLLPDARGRTWYECDVNYSGGFRGGERLLFSSDGLICYSPDHYRSYELIYDGWYDAEN